VQLFAFGAEVLHYEEVAIAHGSCCALSAGASLGVVLSECVRNCLAANMLRAMNMQHC